MKLTKKILKYFIFALIIFVYGMFMLRLCGSNNTEKATNFLWNQDAITAYNKNPDDFNVQTQKQQIVITSDGKFSISDVRYVKGINQLQLTIRYNNSTVNSLVDEYQLSQKPVGEPFIFSLSDNNGKIYKSYEYLADSKNVYNYRRLLFSDVNLDEVKNLFVDIYYIDKVNFKDTPFSSLSVYDVRIPMEEYNISKELFENNQPTAGLSKAIAYLEIE